MAKQAEAAGRKHVLVVDDNVELAQTYQELLQLHDYRVSLAHDGVQALKLLAHSHVDAIICDLSMPLLEGDMFYNAAVHVRPELIGRFVFVTGHAGNPKYDPFLKTANARVLYKPVQVNQLLEALRGLLGPAGV
jgi:two-component system sensor kinase